MEKMDALIRSNLKGLGAIETTQFYRGTIFVALDTIMGRIYEPSDEELLKLAVPFIKKTLELICIYIRLIPEMLVKFEEERIYSDLYLIDENVAITNCHQEFVEMLKTIF